MQRKLLAAVVAGHIVAPVSAQDIPTLGEIVVTATRIPTADVLAPYASEVHTRNQIEKSGATTLYDYLARHTSVNVMPSYGNRFTPLLDMRGYGIGSGSQNIVVSVDGMRLNNIDMMPQLIGAIPLADIERIEVTRGSGAVLFGDGATAGTIQIVTRSHEGVSLAGSVGNHGARAATATSGLKRPRASLSVSATYDHGDGYADPDVTGHKDAAGNRTWRGTLEGRPSDALDLGLDLASSRIDTRYPGPLTLAEFQADPAQNGGNTYNHQRLDTDLWRLRGSVRLAPDWRLTLTHGQEDKHSEYLAPFPFKADYDYASDELSLSYRGRAWDLSAGAQRFDGVRRDRNGFADNDTHKKNSGAFLHSQYRLGMTTFSAGARRERVEYAYVPTAGAANRAEHRLSAWDLGVNHALDGRLSLFANLDRAFQAPDIDRFFNFGGMFNGFIRPAISRTLTLGLNHVTPVNRFKLSLFRADLDDEIYYNPGTFTNTNLDQTHKYGLELQDAWRATETLSARVNYTWTRAIIDRENDGGGAFNGRNLPGVPRHGLTLGLDWQPAGGWNVNLTHTWKSRAYAVNDFANTLTQRQAAYRSTDLAVRYRAGNLEWWAGVENLFAHANGLWIQDDSIYPVNFTRNWRLGLKASF